jgi:hypothetical protein
MTGAAYHSFGKDKKTTAFAFLSYDGVNVNARSKTYNHPFYGPGIQTQIKNHSLGVVWVLPLSTNVKLNRTETEAPDFASTNVISFNASNFIQFSYSYKFNKGRNVKKLDRKVEVESDSKGGALVK